MRESVCACVIAQDEEHRLPRCLASVAFCDETILVDGGSRDRTTGVGRKAGARVIENPWVGFGAQRNVAIDAATTDWILEVDADERVSPGLRAEIEAFLEDPPAEIRVAACPLRDTFLGRPLGPSAKYPRFRYRLFRRCAYRHDESRTVHEGLWARERVWAFTAPLEHVFAESWREALVDTWNYAALEARQQPESVTLLAAGIGIALRPPSKFGYRLLVDGGWRDGWRGWARIGLECLGDILVWTRRLLARTGEGPGTLSTSHFSTGQLVGQVRIVAVADGAASVERALSWLREAEGSGVDVALLTNAGTAPDDPMRVQHLPRLGTLALIRALDLEYQLRPYDALLASGPRVRRLLKRMPARLRGAAAPARLDEEPTLAVGRVRREARAEHGPHPLSPSEQPG